LATACDCGGRDGIYFCHMLSYFCMNDTKEHEQVHVRLQYRRMNSWLPRYFFGSRVLYCNFLAVCIFREQCGLAAPRGQCAGGCGGSPGCQGRAWQAGPIPHPSQEQCSRRAPAQAQARLSGTALGTGRGRGWAVSLALGWTQLSGAHGQAGPVCGELETGLAVVSPGQGLAPLGG